eukprot:3104896-Rhodomonas_salina.1
MVASPAERARRKKTCAADAGGAAAGNHPVAVHARDDAKSRACDLLCLFVELEHAREAVDVERGVDGVEADVQQFAELQEHAAELIDVGLQNFCEVDQHV